MRGRRRILCGLVRRIALPRSCWVSVIDTQATSWSRMMVICFTLISGISLETSKRKPLVALLFGASVLLSCSPPRCNVFRHSLAASGVLNVRVLSQMAQVMKETDSSLYSQFEQACVDAYNVVREHGFLFLTYFVAMLPAGLPELASEADINYLRKKLAVEVGCHASCLVSRV
jgi:hypothetical protein